MIDASYDMAHEVFISYSSTDKPVADAACAKLEGEGVRCWIAPRDIMPGIDWSEAIVGAIDTSKILILVFSAHSNKSEHVKREINRAVNQALKIIPVRVQDVPMSESLQYYIGTPHWLDALTPPLEQHLNALVKTVQLLLSQQVPGELPPSILQLMHQADSGDVAAMNNLGLAFAEGRGVPRDYDKSTPWFRRAAELGDPLGMSNYGVALLHGHGTTRDFEEGIRWLTRAVSSGNAMAMCNLGEAHQYGTGIEQDIGKAIQLYQRAVSENESRAMANLGYLYLVGEGVALDFDRARQLFAQGARLGDARCMYNLGTMHENGQACDRDENAAVTWYQRAAQKGFQMAKDRLVALGYREA